MPSSASSEMAVWSCVMADNDSVRQAHAPRKRGDHTWLISSEFTPRSRVDHTSPCGVRARDPGQTPRATGARLCQGESPMAVRRFTLQPTTDGSPLPATSAPPPVRSFRRLWLRAITRKVNNAVSVYCGAITDVEARSRRVSCNYDSVANLQMCTMRDTDGSSAVTGDDAAVDKVRVLRHGRGQRSRVRRSGQQPLCRIRQAHKQSSAG